MASGSPAEKPSQAYACKCLNVQITSSTQAPASSPEGTCDPAYEPIFVNDEGIVITHPQVTVRTTTHAEPIPGTSRHSRFIVLTCLLCRLPAYRVFQTISLDIHGNESILLPTDDWVERDILKSSTGWIQVHKDGIVGDSICQAKASPSYSPLFSLLLPSELPPPIPSSPKPNTETSPSKSAEPPIQTSLPALRPLFFPPPFTPSHPIFVHLASIANEESQNLRGTAEQRIADFVKAETAAIEAREQSLRHQVEVFWTTYKDHLNALQEEPRRKQTSNVARSPVSHSGFGPGAVIKNNSSVSIRNFDPVPISPSLSPLPSGPRISALSASLATSTFHHLNTDEARTHSSGGSASSHTLSTYSKSSTLIPDAVPVAINNILQYKRNVDDDINTQASYKYFVNLEEDVARYKRSQEVAMKEQQEAEAGKREQQAPTQAGSSGVNTNGNLKHKNVVQATKPQTTTEDGSARHEETVSPRERDKGKRKVTFDVEPVVMTSKTEADGKVEEDDSGEMVFALEDLEGEEDTGDSSDIQHSTLPLLEQAVSRSLRPRTIRSPNHIETFSSLRPSSLPNPSHIRPMRGQPHVDSSSHVMLPRPKVLITPTPGGSRSPPQQHGLSPQILTEHDAELLRLVAADTPSHRGAWTPNSRAWRTFIRRQDLKEDVDRSKILEEREETEEMDSAEEKPPVVTGDQLADDDYSVNVSQPTSSSVPISIVIRNQPPESLNLSSYRPKTTAIPNQSNGDVPSLPHGQKTTSSTSFRKAKYAERDRARSMDPGALDFAAIEEDDVEVEKTTPTDQISGERGRKLALKILKARSELPEAGMWRSLV